MIYSIPASNEPLVMELLENKIIGLLNHFTTDTATAVYES